MKLLKTTFAAALTILFAANALAAGGVPSDVEGLTAEAGDQTITLKWDPAVGEATITKYMVFQGPNSVKTASDRYEKRYDAGNATEYEVTGLENDTRYYFAVIAFDENGEHSENYSNEVSAMPKSATESGETDTSSESPKVTAAEVINSEEVKIVFSKDITIPSENPEKAFSIKENTTDAKLEVLGAKILESDTKAVILTTEKQTANAEYFLTVHSDVVDKDNNPIVSGTSDTASFKGSDVEKTEASPSPTSTPDVADTTAPTIKEVNVVSNTKIEIVFTEEIKLTGAEPKDSFQITEKENWINEIAVKDAKILKDDPSIVEVETELQAANMEYEITVMQVEDLAGNSISELLNGNRASYTSKEAEIADILPPEDVTKFMAKIIMGNSVKLSWTPSANTAKDLVDQILYQSTNTNDFVKVDNLGPAVTSYTLNNLKAGVKYSFKLTVKDAAGNESEGVITTITLPETGAGLGIALIGTAIGMVGYHRRRKIKNS